MTIKVQENFTSICIKTVDVKNRINLGEKVLKTGSSTDVYEIFVGKDGDILLRPVVTIPAKEAWIYENPKVIGKIRKGLAEAKQGKVKKVKSLASFLKKV